MLRKVTVIAILITLVLASFPTLGVMAKSEINAKLEAKWDQLVTNFNKQEQYHSTAHNVVKNWLSQHKNAKTADKNAVQRHLDICNSAMSRAQAIVTAHAGFDAKGKVVDRALAQTSVKDLAFYLNQHAASVRNLKAHVK